MNASFNHFLVILLLLFTADLFFNFLIAKRPVRSRQDRSILELFRFDFYQEMILNGRHHFVPRTIKTNQMVNIRTMAPLNFSHTQTKDIYYTIGQT